jgi:hypothetical protein
VVVVGRDDHANDCLDHLITVLIAVQRLLGEVLRDDLRIDEQSNLSKLCMTHGDTLDT